MRIKRNRPSWTTMFMGLACFLSALIAPRSLQGQDFDLVRRLKPFPVTVMDQKQERQLDYPFLGGFNSPRPQFVDLDEDDDLDLVVQEQNTPTLMLFENLGTREVFDFRWRTDAYREFNVGNWYRFADFDLDGDPDLFAESPFSRIRIYENLAEIGNVDFVMLVDTLRDVNGQDIVFDLSSLPELADIDCDEHLDLFLGGSAAGTVTYYENVGLSDTGVPRFEFVTDRFQDISIIGGGSAFAGRQLSSASPSAHGASTFTFSDIDNDNDLDLFWGDLFEPSIIFLRNDGSCEEPDIKIASSDFPPPTPLFSSGFNAPRFADIDADGDLDLFVGILGGVFSLSPHLSANFYYYENFGSADSPVFSLISTQFISTLDIGANSIPAFADIDGDEDLDLFLANEEDPADPVQGHLYYFENIGTTQAPEFKLVDDDFLELELGTNLAPVFVDIDADDDLDLFIGGWDGKLNFIENTGSAQEPKFAPVVEIFGQIDVGNHNIPAFGDIDGDNDLDLLIGNFLGVIWFYENLGSATEYDFSSEPVREYSAIDVGLHCSIELVDYDNSGTLDLVLGSEQDGLFFYRNDGSALDPDFAPDQGFAAAVEDRAAPRLVDIDADGDLDFFAGLDRGGLLFYENRAIVASVETETPATPTPDGFALRQNFPNPFNPETRIAFEVPETTPVRISIYNLLGEEVRVLLDEMREAGEHRVTWDGKDANGQPVPSGVYVYRITARDFRATRRMVLLR